MVFVYSLTKFEILPVFFANHGKKYRNAIETKILQSKNQNQDIF